MMYLDEIMKNEDAEFRPKRSPLALDIMVGGHYYTTIKVSVDVGSWYHESDFKMMARFKLPSLEKKDFRAIPTEQFVLK